MIKYAEDLRQHPCNFCAKRIGSEVTCTTTGITRTYFPNGSHEDIITRIPIKHYFNFTLNFTK
jgi:hypothetical protein